MMAIPLQEGFNHQSSILKRAFLLTDMFAHLIAEESQQALYGHGCPGRKGTKRLPRMLAHRLECGNKFLPSLAILDAPEEIPDER